jgi:hypothetical protein
MQEKKLTRCRRNVHNEELSNCALHHSLLVQKINENNLYRAFWSRVEMLHNVSDKERPVMSGKICQNVLQVNRRWFELAQNVIVNWRIL